MLMLKWHMWRRRRAVRRTYFDAAVAQGAGSASRRSAGARARPDSWRRAGGRVRTPPVAVLAAPSRDAALRRRRRRPLAARSPFRRFEESVHAGAPYRPRGARGPISATPVSRQGRLCGATTRHGRRRSHTRLAGQKVYIPFTMCLKLRRYYWNAFKTKL